MKPRVFIGSSVEGLSVAYAVQQNLLHDAEVTVWDQGVFELSSTSIDSMIGALGSNDFGIFVFSSDDILRMRGEELASVRDNVIFEFGLFIGRLGRDRVFFLLPSSADIHIPTDLIGITPGRYENNRSDGSMQAATGPACHQIRSQVKKLGPLEYRESSSSPSEDIIDPKPIKRKWFQDLFDKKYDSAIDLLKIEMVNLSGDRVIEHEMWIKYCEFKLDDKLGADFLAEIAQIQPTAVKAYTSAAFILRFEGFIDRSIDILKEAKSIWGEDASVDISLSESYVENDDTDLAIQLLKNSSNSGSLEISLSIATILEGVGREQEAISVLQRYHLKNPRNIAVRYKLARLYQDVGDDLEALYLLDGLTREDDGSIEYWGYLGNSCLQLELYDMALIAYQRADSLTDSGSQWIRSNIGNLFANLKLHSEACSYLGRAIEKDPQSEYAHNRLASALKRKDEEHKEFKKKCKEGFAQIRAKNLSEISVQSDNSGKPD